MTDDTHRLRPAKRAGTNFKLGMAQVDEIVRLHDTGQWPYHKLANLFSVSTYAIWYTINCRAKGLTLGNARPKQKGTVDNEQ